MSKKNVTQESPLENPENPPAEVTEISPAGPMENDNDPKEGEKKEEGQTDDTEEEPTLSAGDTLAVRETEEMERITKIKPDPTQEEKKEEAPSIFFIVNGRKIDCNNHDLGPAE